MRQVIRILQPVTPRNTTTTLQVFSLTKDVKGLCRNKTDTPCFSTHRLVLFFLRLSFPFLLSILLVSFFFSLLLSSSPKDCGSTNSQPEFEGNIFTHLSHRRGRGHTHINDHKQTRPCPQNHSQTRPQESSQRSPRSYHNSFFAISAPSLTVFPNQKCRDVIHKDPQLQRRVIFCDFTPAHPATQYAEAKNCTWTPAGWP